MQWWDALGTSQSKQNLGRGETLVLTLWVTVPAHLMTFVARTTLPTSPGYVLTTVPSLTESSHTGLLLGRQPFHVSSLPLYMLFPQPGKLLPPFSSKYTCSAFRSIMLSPFVTPSDLFRRCSITVWPWMSLWKVWGQLDFPAWGRLAPLCLDGRGIISPLFKFCSTKTFSHLSLCFHFF